MKKILSSKVFNIALFAVAVGLLMFSSIGGARAALTYFSQTYASRVQLSDIGASLLENGNIVSYRDYDTDKADGTWKEATGVLCENLLKNDKGDTDTFKIGKAYDEEISVKNSGTIDQYVRVTLYKYWTDADGNKCQNLDPSLIGLNVTTNGSDWILDEEASTEERSVFYYSKLLGAGDETSNLTDQLAISNDITNKVTESTDSSGNKVYTFAYDGCQFVIEAEVDAIQDHNAADAILSTWGRNVTISNDTLSLE